MPASPSHDRSDDNAGSASLRWSWIGSGVLIGAVLLTLFASLMQFSEKPAIAAFVALLSVVVAAMLVGYYSHGETIRETAVAAFFLAILMALISTTVLGIRIPVFAWLVSPFLVPFVALLGGWAGELLQGTLDEAYEDRAVDWPWVFCSVVLGFTLGALAVLIAREQFATTIGQNMVLFACSFLVTGWIVGFFSPGNTIIEPALAAALMAVLDLGFLVLWFERIPSPEIIMPGLGAGIVLALVGGGLGEFAQRLTARARKPAQHG